MTSVEILGCRVDALDARAAVERVMQLARGDAPAVVVTLGTEMVMRAQRDAAFRSVIARSALSLCDTIGVLVAARLAGVRIPERVSGVDLIDPIAEACARDALAIYLIGGKGDTAARAARAIALRHPSLRIAGVRDGYFSDAQSGAVASAIARSGARILFLGLGSPKQEIWLARYLQETRCSVGIGIGGSLDVLAGNVERAPERWRDLNLEWLYRLVREPSRWRRQLALPKFAVLVARDAVRTAIVRRFI